MDTIFQSNPGMSSRIAHHLDFPGYAQDDLQIGDRMLDDLNIRFGEGVREVFADRDRAWSPEDLVTLEADDIRASRVFSRTPA